MKRLPCLIVSLCLIAVHVAASGELDLYVPQMQPYVKPRIRVLDREQRDGYECRLVEFSVSALERINAYLLVPDMASRRHRCPAVVMLHDHGARFDIGKEKLVRPIVAALPDGTDDHVMRSSRQWVDKYFDGAYLADSLAASGYVVFIADALYWGERSSEEAQRWSELTYGKDDSKSVRDSIKVLKKRVYEGQKTLYDDLYSDGVIWAEKILWDDVASVNLLAGLPYVDRDNIGAFGFSMGAHRCWMLSAFCKDVSCGVALSWMTSLDRKERIKPSDYSMAVMPMREQLDFGDIGLFLAPKPMLFLNGDSDHLFPKEKVEVAFAKLQKHYSDYNRDHLGEESLYEPQFEPLQTLFFHGGHHCGKEIQKTITRFLDDNLKN